MVPAQLVPALRLAWSAATRPHNDTRHSVRIAYSPLILRCRLASVEREPVRPVAAHIEEVVEVHKARLFKVPQKGLERVFVEYGPDDDEVALDTKLLIRETQAFVDSSSRYSRALKSRPANKKTWFAGWKFYWHVMVRAGTRKWMHPDPSRS